MTLSIIIIDDEAPARTRLRDLLADAMGEVPNEVVAEAANGELAIEAMNGHPIDVALVDIRMPGMDGIELARHISRLDRPPTIIFVTAYGDYNIDSRAYNIYLHGEDLDSRIPTKEPKFYCLVTLDGEIHCDGDVKHLVAFGSFSSGGGFYSLIPFNGISGTFNNRYRALDFYDVTIDTNFGLIHTDAFHIIDGKLHLGTIELVDRETGKTMSVADARNREGPMKTIKQIQQNIKEIKEQAKALKP